MNSGHSKKTLEAVSNFKKSLQTEPKIDADGGGTLVFTGAVTASEPGLTLRWERDGEPLEDDARISGARTDTLVIDRAGIDDVGEYRLAATLGTTTVRSAIAAGVVRATLLGPIDANGDGVLDFHDMIRFLRSYDEVSP